ncbi:MAG: cell wall-binding repeat-containing protein [Euzebya sp.]
MRGIKFVATMTVMVLMLAGVSSAQTGEVISVVNSDGPDSNVAVALALSAITNLGQVDTVILARDDQFADALASGVLQGSSPLLLVPSSGAVPQAVTDRLTELAPTQVVILGGENAISPEVEAELAQTYIVERRAGASRLETAIDIATTDVPFATTAILARAFPAAGSTDPTQAFADSLAAGGWSAATGWPVLLTQSEVLSTSTADYLADASITEIKIVGGLAAVSAEVETALRDLGITVERVAGSSRFATAVATADARATTSGRSIVVEGQAADAWAAGFAAAGRSAALDAPIVLTTGPTLPEVTATFLTGLQGAEGDPAQLTCVTDPTACEAAAAARGAEINPFTLQDTIFASDPVATDYLGVSIDVDGDRMVVGGVRSGNNPGRAVVYERDQADEWQEVADLRGDVDCLAFGSDVAIDGNTVIVGAPRACGGDDMEQVRVFHRNPSGDWSLTQTINSPNDDPSGGFNNGFGATVALDDGTLFTGTYSFSTPGVPPIVARGVVDIFREGPDGTFQPSQSIQGPSAHVGFGTAVAVQGDRAVVLAFPENSSTGGPNPHFVLQRNAGGTWAVDAELPSDTVPGSTTHTFSTIAMDGDLIAVGDQLDGDPRTGSATVYRNVGGDWDDGTAVTTEGDDFFGASVAFLDGILMVGANNGVGRIYAFAPDGENWVQVGVRGPDHPFDGGGFGTARFGSSMAAADGRLMVGAPLHSGTVSAQGAVFEYTFSP